MAFFRGVATLPSGDQGTTYPTAARPVPHLSPELSKTCLHPNEAPCIRSDSTCYPSSARRAYVTARQTCHQARTAVGYQLRSRLYFTTGLKPLSSAHRLKFSPAEARSFAQQPGTPRIMIHADKSATLLLQPWDPHHSWANFGSKKNSYQPSASRKTLLQDRLYLLQPSLSLLEGAGDDRSEISAVEVLDPQKPKMQFFQRFSKGSPKSCISTSGGVLEVVKTTARLPLRCCSN